MMYTLADGRNLRMMSPILVCLIVGLALVSNIGVAWAQTGTQFAHPLAGNQQVGVTALALSENGEIFVAGGLRGTADFDPGPGEYLLSGGSDDVAFIAKYGPAGEFIWAHRLAGNGDVLINDIVVDPMNQIGVAGSFEGVADLDPGPAVFEARSQGDHDIFLLRLLTDGTLQWAWTAGNSEEDAGIAVTTDATSALYIAGKFEGKINFKSDLSETPSFEHTSVGGTDGFLARFNNAGYLTYVHVLGGDEDDEATDVALGAGHIYLVGTFAGEADLDPTWTAFEARSRGRTDIFVTILTTGGAWRTSLQLGGTGTDGNARLLLEPDGTFYVSGEFESSADFGWPSDGGVLESRGQRDIFLTRYGPPPHWEFQWAFGIGGEQDETLGDLAQDSFGSVYLLGTFSDIIDVEPGDASTLLPSNGGTDIFLAKYSQQAQLRRVQGMANPLDDSARGLAIDRSGNVLLAGEFRGTLDLGEGLTVSSGQPDEVSSGFFAAYARDTWTPLLENAYLPGVMAGLAAE